MESKRSHYRVEPRHGAMRLTLCGPEGGSVEGELLNLSVQGAGASFPESDMPAVMPGDRVQLEFRTMLLLQPLVTEAILRRIDAVGGELRVGFEFADPRTVLRDVPYVLRPYFNRRRHPRVEIEEPIEVDLVAPGVKARGWLRQLGVGGAMVTLPMELAERLTRRDRVEIRFQVGERDEPFWFLAVVRGLWQSDDELGCSLRFDRLGTVDYRDQREAVEAVVAARRAARSTEAESSEASGT